MAVKDGDDLCKHIGHKIETVAYGYDDEDGGEMFAVAVECVDCNEVIIEFAFVEDGEQADVPDVKEEPVICPRCEWSGSSTDSIHLAKMPYLGMVLMPGETIPHGGCPKCGELVYPVWRVS